MACGKYAARCTSEAHGNDIVSLILDSRKASGIYWTTPEGVGKEVPWLTVQADLDAAWAAPKAVPQAVVKCKMTIIDEDVKPLGEPTITVEKIEPGIWGAVVNGKYYAPCSTEQRVEEIAKNVKVRRGSGGYGWCSMATKTAASSHLVDAEWPKLPVKEDIKTVVVNQDENGNWRVVLNDEWYAPCGGGSEAVPLAQSIECDTLNGKPHKGWSWKDMTTKEVVQLRDFLNLKG